MNILELPEEIILLVLQQVDLRSLLNLYETCSVFKRLVCVHGVKTASLSLNTLATVKTLQLNSFKDISRKLEELNLCAVKDLSKTAIVQAMKRFSKLKTLNISFTCLGIPDLIDIYKFCPTIKNVSVNFSFGKGIGFEVPQKLLEDSQEMFKHFENVEFVGSRFNLLCTQLPLYVLQKAKLFELKLTAIKVAENMYQRRDSEQMVCFHCLSIYILNWKVANELHGWFGELPIFSALNLMAVEYIIIKTCGFGICKAYVSPVFRNVLSAHFAVDEDMVTELSGNVVCMFWNRETTKFDEKFFSHLLEQIKVFFPSPCHGPQQIKKTISTEINNNRKYLTVTPDLQTSSEHEQIYEPLTKRKRIQACNEYVLAFDYVSSEISDVKLSINFKEILNPVRLCTGSDYLKNITYLSLYGIVHYGHDFFDVLFKFCGKLVTLNVEAKAYTHRTCSTLLAKSINNSSSLRNLRIIEKQMEYKTLLVALSQCISLENIHIFDLSSANIVIPVIPYPSLLIKNLPNLYSIFIQALISKRAINALSREFKNAISKYGKPYINIELIAASTYGGPSYDPFISVFDVSPIKPV